MGLFQIILFPFYFIRRLLFGKGSSSLGIPLQDIDNYRYDLTASRADGELLWIQGRPPVIIGFILNLFGIAPKPSVLVNRKAVHFTYKSVFSENHLVVPLEDITVADCRYEKPAWRLYLGIFLMVMTISVSSCGFLVAILPLVLQDTFANVTDGLSTNQAQSTFGQGRSASAFSSSDVVGFIVSTYAWMTLIPLVIAAILLFTYWQTKRISITFSTGNIDERAGLAFSRTLAKDIDYDEFVKVYHLINRYIIEAHYARFDNPLAVKAISSLRNQDETPESLNSSDTN